MRVGVDAVGLVAQPVVRRPALRDADGRRQTVAVLALGDETEEQFCIKRERFVNETAAERQRGQQAHGELRGHVDVNVLGMSC